MSYSSWVIAPTINDQFEVETRRIFAHLMWTKVMSLFSREEMEEYGQMGEDQGLRPAKAKFEQQLLQRLGQSLDKVRAEIWLEARMKAATLVTKQMVTGHRASDIQKKEKRDRQLRLKRVEKMTEASRLLVKVIARAKLGSEILGEYFTVEELRQWNGRLKFGGEYEQELLSEIEARTGRKVAEIGSSLMEEVAKEVIEALAVPANEMRDWQQTGKDEFLSAALITGSVSELADLYWDGKTRGSE